MTGSPADVVRSFCAAWSRLDVEELMGYFTDDAVYHNMPGPPAVGRAAVRATIERFLKGWTRTDWEIRNLVASGDLVFCERIDRTEVGGRHVDLPLVGLFDIVNGSVRAWRDDFDLAPCTRAGSG